MTENQFEDLIAKTFSKIEDSEVVKTTADLKRLIFANGIMAEKTTTKGRFYRFAPIYWYSWGLVNSVLENEERKKPNKLVEDKEFEGTIIEVTKQNGKVKKVIETDACGYPLIAGPLYNFIPGDIVIFTAQKRPGKKDPNATFWYATNVHSKK